MIIKENMFYQVADEDLSIDMQTGYVECAVFHRMTTLVNELYALRDELRGILRTLEARP